MPTYSFKCCLCGESSDFRCLASQRPETISCSNCQGTARYQFVPSAYIATCPLSIDDQQQREWIEYGNRKTPEQIRQWEKTQQDYADKKAKEPVRPSFDECLDSARRELTARKIDYSRPTI